MPHSKALQRQEYIMSLLETRGEVAANELAEKLKVSVWTIRRDLASLEERGVLHRYYGGANQSDVPGAPCQLTDRDSLRDSFRASSDLNLESKRRIGKAVARMIHPGERLAIGGGTTTLEVARALRAINFKGEIVTNALDIALELAEVPDIHIFCTGGDVQPRYHTLVGSVTERMLKIHYFDTTIVGVSGISPRHGITVNSQVDATALELMIEHSCRNIVVADRSKFGQVCFVSLSPAVQINYLITDAVISTDYQNYLKSKEINLIITD